MIIGLIFFVAVAGSYSIHAYTIDPTWAHISVPNPPAQDDDADEDYTWIRDDSGNITKIHKDIAAKVPVPFFTAEHDTRFELFTPKNPNEPQLLVLGNSTSIKKSHFNPKYPTRILTHGWNSEGLLTPRFAKTYLVDGKHKVNFIALNWQAGSDTYNYFAARGRVKEVGQHLGRFIDFMVEHHKLKLKDLTLIGHSLGAHVSGIAGKSVTKGKVAKIVGLDPAKPFFSFKDVEGRLDETDALYVEVMHTCAGTLGFSQPIGMASFYPNGGSSQPGCSLDPVGMCAHGRSYEYFLESLLVPRFIAFQCESYDDVKKKNCPVVNELAKMGGEPGTKYTEGIFYLETNPVPIYAQGKPGVFKTIMKSNQTKNIMLTGLKTNFMDVVNRKLKNFEEIEAEISTNDY